ncbi:DUF2170 family protein [Salmonella enterica]|nr:DUF2170 family protein [Salmonella enterica]EKS5918721.1 DUF2170 family protein [Salmonella enterica]
MNDYGDLPLTVLFTSQQIVIETYIFPVNTIRDTAEFNLFLLRNQKFLPLSSVGIIRVKQSEEAIDEAQGVRMLEQHIRDAKASLETRALAAMSKNVDATLLNEVAEEIARLENTILAEEQVLTNQEASRDAVEKAVTAAGQRIAQFEQQLEVVKATEAMQRTQQAVTTSTVGAASNVSTAAESLKRLQTRQAERQARQDAAAQLEKVADGHDLDEKLAQSGIGATNKSCAQDALARLQRQQGE